MKVITDKYYKKPNSVIVVPDDANFNTMINLKGKTSIVDNEGKTISIGEAFNRIITKIAVQNDLQKIIDIVDFNDENKLGKGKDMVDALTGLVEIFQDPELDFSNNRADDDDILGDAYEYLIKQFASESGKSKGQFYTPSEVSKIMSKLLKINEATKTPITVYDMACGSGSLLLKAGAEANEGIKVCLYGQEKDNTTAGLAVMNMFLHANPEAIIKVGNTLTNPLFIEKNDLRTFDYCVANPPFSVKKWKNGLENEYNRFLGFGTPPDSCADYAFLLHLLKSLEPKTGRGATILPHGVLFRGGQEETIRKNLIKSGFIEGIIGLPTNLFYGTGIPACIIVLDKKNAKDRKDIFMIDASKYFIKDQNKNKLREEDIKKIVDTYLSRIEIAKYSKIVTLEEIEKEEYNLNIPRYIDSSEEENIQDINAHLFGGIPERDIDKYKTYWQIAPMLKEKLFTKNKKEGYLDLTVEKDELNEFIKESEETKKYSKELKNKITNWQNKNYQVLSNINNETRVINIISEISDSILDIFKDDKLIDKYDAYEYLMEYYNDIMKDDMHMIVANGWIPKLTFKTDNKGKTKKNEFDSDLLPKEIVINEYFKIQKEHIELLNVELNNLISEFEILVEENTGDEQLFKDDDKVNEKLIKSLIPESMEEEIDLLNSLLNNLNKQKAYKKEIKLHQEELNKKIINKYGQLDTETSKNLIINKKWYQVINNTFDEKFEDLIYKLSSEITTEVENYENTLSSLLEQTNTYEQKLFEDLKRMGY